MSLTVSWGGRRALNALVGGVGTPAHATSRAHKLWARLLRGHAQVLAGGFACDGEPPSMLLAIFRIVYRSILPRDHSIVYRKGRQRLHVTLLTILRSCTGAPPRTVWPSRIKER